MGVESIGIRNHPINMTKRQEHSGAPDILGKSYIAYVIERTKK